MAEPIIDDLLRRSAPAEHGLEPGVQSALRGVMAESREAARAPQQSTEATRTPRRTRRSRLAWLAVPVIGLPAVAFATTAAVEPRLVPDFTIPVSYTTDTGTSISCSIDLFNGELNHVESSTAAVDFYSQQDWSGVGQRIYERALDYENDPAWLSSEMNSDGPGLSSETLQYRAFITAQDDFILDQLPTGTLVSGDGGYGSQSDCTGELH